MAHAFLSDEWFDALEALRSEAPEPPPGVDDLVVNLVVTDAPQGDVNAHLAGGQVAEGHVDGAPTTVEAPYGVVRSLIVEAHRMAVAKAFLSGQIKITGDMARLLALQELAVSPEQQAFAERVAALTA